MKNPSEKQYWLFVTKPEYYLDKKNEYSLKEGGKHHWSCHKNTQKGDEILFYLTTGPAKKGTCIKYRAEAIGRARGVPPPEENDEEEHWTGSDCDIQIRKDYDPPLLLSEFSKLRKPIDTEPDLEGCTAIRKNFQGTVFPLKKREWDCFIRLLEKKEEMHILEKHAKRQEKEKVQLTKQIFGSDPDKNKQVERAAIEFVVSEYESKGWKVKSVESENIGYDLLCKRASKEEHVEVKGLSGEDRNFILTQNELKNAKENPNYLFYIVRNALKKKPKGNRYTYNEFKKYYDYTPLAYTCKSKPIEE